MDNILDIKKEYQMFRKKDNKYKEEREIILNTIYNILGVDENKKDFYSHEIHDEQLKELINDIVKYYSVSNWSILKCKDNKHIGLSIVKFIFKNMNVKLEIIGGKKVKIDNKFIYTTLYRINEDFIKI